MANIQKITEFKAGRETLGDIHYTVYYDTGRRVNYYGRDTLPMTVVNILTDENTVSETVYIEDNYLHCVNSRTTYIPADKPQEAPAAEAEQQPTETENAPQAATQAAPAADPDAVTLAPADMACVWTEAGDMVQPVGVWLDDGSATDSNTARDMIRANLEYLTADDPARAEQFEILEELDRQEGRQPAQEPKKTTEPAGRIYHVYFTDNPYQAMTVKARTKREAEKAGRLYIRQWQLDATIDRIERDEGEAIPF